MCTQNRTYTIRRFTEFVNFITTVTATPLNYNSTVNTSNKNQKLSRNRHVKNVTVDRMSFRTSKLNSNHVRSLFFGHCNFSSRAICDG